MAQKKTSAKGSLKRRPTLKDVAALAGVSTGTVSIVFSNAPRARAYSEQTKARIRAAAKQIGYVPNPLAKTLKKSKSGLIGVVLFSRQSAYYGRPLQAAETCAREAGYEVVTADLRYNIDRLEACLPTIAAWRVEGLLLITGGKLTDSSEPQAWFPQGAPCVKGGIRHPDDSCSCVSFDYVEAGRLLAKHVTDLGHHHVGVLAAHPDNLSSEERLRGIQTFWKEQAMSPENLHVIKSADANIGMSAGYRLAGELLKCHPELTALLCQNDKTALGAIRRLHEEGRKVPDDVSVAGFDDLPLDASDEEGDRLGAFTCPSLTTIRTPLDEMGRAAMKMLIEIMADERLHRARRTLNFSPELVIRESTGPAKGAPPLPPT